MNVLALDLGSTTGIAYGAGPTPVINSLTWAIDKELKLMRQQRFDRRGDIRVIRFFDWLTETHKCCKFDAVVFEDVKFVRSRAQAHLWASFRTSVWLAFPRTRVECVDVGTLKKFATGSGAADKTAMLGALVRLHPEMIRLGETPDDNAVDAAWLWLWAIKNLGRAKV
jgi:Holliday junction resolvasome RuvABC endonuclease subunit